VLTAQIDPDLVDACGTDPAQLCEWAYDATGNSVLAGIVDWVFDKPVKIFLILVVAWVVRRLIFRAIDRMVDRLVADRDSSGHDTVSQVADEEGRGQVLIAASVARLYDRMERAQQRARTLGVLAKSAASVVVLSVATLMALSELAVNLGPLIAGAGVLGIAIGFGSQALVRDVISGVFMLVEDQYGVGDWVDVGEAAGTVETVGLRTTRLRDSNGTLWFVPNGEIRRVGNMSQLWARSVLDITVSYDTDLDLAIRVIKEVADGLWHENREEATILEEPNVLGVQDLGADAVAVRLSVKTDPSEQWAIGRLLRRRLKDALDANGIEIPFPQRTVWIRTEDGDGIGNG
jgi:moderate conductance mechanosensitive channel